MQGVPNLATLLFGDNIQTVCDRSTGIARPVFPVALRMVVFDALHGLQNLGLPKHGRSVPNGLQKKFFRSGQHVAPQPMRNYGLQAHLNNGVRGGTPWLIG